MKRGLILALALMAGMAGTASAATITQSYCCGLPLGPVYNVAAVEDSTRGGEMGGMTVSALLIYPYEDYYRDITLRGVWVDGLFGEAGGIQWMSGTHEFSLSVSGDTFSNTWNLVANSSTYRLLSLHFNTLPGTTLFDTGFGGNTGTAGSSFGQDFAGFDSYGGKIRASYSNPVSVNGAAPIGDLYASLTLYFNDGSYGQGIGTLPSGNYSFTLDTDRVTVAAVPEPGSMLLLGTGLVGLASRLRRRKIV